jgi:hypothetical protein
VPGIAVNVILVVYKTVVEKKGGKKKEKKRLLQPLYIEPVTSLIKCRVAFFGLTKTD